MKRKYDTISVVIPIYKTPISKLLRCMDHLYYEDTGGYVMQVVLIFDGEYNEINKLTQWELLHQNKLHITPYQCKTNMGTFYARLMGMQLSIGDVIFEVDPDDYIASGAIKLIMDEMNKQKCDLLPMQAFDTYLGYLDRTPRGKENYNYTVDCIKPASYIFSWDVAKIVFDDQMLEYAKSHKFTYAEDVAESYLLTHVNGVKIGKVPLHHIHYVYDGSGPSNTLSKGEKFYLDQFRRLNEICFHKSGRHVPEYSIFDQYESRICNLAREYDNDHQIDVVRI